MPPTKLLDGLVALVTGGGSGYGEGISKLFAEEGARVVILDINEEGGQRVATEINKVANTALFVKTDVTCASEWGIVVSKTIETFGQIDILINNAGWTYRRKDSLKVSEDEYDRLFDINVKGIYHSINAIMPQFLKQGSGNIVNVSSCVTSKPVDGLLYYNASKAAVDLLTRGLASEFSGRGIRVNGVSPSMGATGLAADFVGTTFTAEVAKAKATEAPLNRLCTPDDIAKACLYFAAPWFNDFETGIMLRVDGGQYC